MKKTLLLTSLASLSLISTTYSTETDSPFSYIASEEPLYIQMNVYDDDHRFFKLSDGSFWIINTTYDTFFHWYAGKDEQSFWLKPDRISVKESTNAKFPYLLINEDKGQMVEARQIDPQIYFEKQLERSIRKPIPKQD